MSEREHGGFRIVPGDTPDDIDLELWSLGAVRDPEAARRIAAHAEGAGAELAAELEAARRAWAGAPPLPIGGGERFLDGESLGDGERHEDGGAADREAAEGGAADETSRDGSAGGWWARFGARSQRWALAALVLLVIGGTLGWWARDVTLDGPGGVRAMGGVAVDLVVTRDGEVLAPPWHLRGGDRLHLSATSPIDGWLEVVSLQEDGGVSVLVAGEALPVAAGVPVTVDGAVQLDDHEGREWLVVGVTDRPRSEAAVAREARRRLPIPTSDARSWVIEVTRAR